MAAVKSEAKAKIKHRRLNIACLLLLFSLILVACLPHCRNKSTKPPSLSFCSLFFSYFFVCVGVSGGEFAGEPPHALCIVHCALRTHNTRQTPPLSKLKNTTNQPTNLPLLNPTQPKGPPASLPFPHSPHSLTHSLAHSSSDQPTIQQATRP